jgi:hypothetical protein
MENKLNGLSGKPRSLQLKVRVLVVFWLEVVLPMRNTQDPAHLYSRARSLDSRTLLLLWRPRHTRSCLPTERRCLNCLLYLFFRFTSKTACQLAPSDGDRSQRQRTHAWFLPLPASTSAPVFLFWIFFGDVKYKDGGDLLIILHKWGHNCNVTKSDIYVICTVSYDPRYLVRVNRICMAYL